MPMPLMESLHRHIHMGKYKGGAKSSFAENSGNIPPSYAKPQIMIQSSRFVDSEKKLKQQLKMLLEKQNTEKKHKPDNPDNSILGVKISNRYLGEDLLPYPKSKADEQEWERQMELRKAELSKLDSHEWKEILEQHNQDMEHFAPDEGNAARMSHGSDHNIDERIHNSAGYKKRSGESESVEPKAATDGHHHLRWQDPIQPSSSNLRSAFIVQIMMQFLPLPKVTIYPSTWH